MIKRFAPTLTIHNEEPESPVFTKDLKRIFYPEYFDIQKPTTRPKVLAIDLSLDRTGITLIYELSSSKDITAVSYPLISRYKEVTGKTKKGADKTKFVSFKGTDRIKYIVSAIARALRKYPDIIVIEGYSYQSKGRSVFDIAEIGGIVRMLIQDYLDMNPETKFLEVSPNTLKCAASDNGGVQKKFIWKFCNARFGTTFEKNQEDEADSYVLAMIALMLDDSYFMDKFVSIETTRDTINKLSFSRDVRSCQNKKKSSSK